MRLTLTHDAAAEVTITAAVEAMRVRLTEFGTTPSPSSAEEHTLEPVSGREQDDSSVTNTLAWIDASVERFLRGGL